MGNAHIGVRIHSFIHSLGLLLNCDFRPQLDPANICINAALLSARQWLELIIGNKKN
jgi:hypothetical protein